MHIGLDASRVTVLHRTGTEHYARRLIESLLALPSPHAFTLYFRHPPPPGWPPPRAAAPAPTLRVIPFPRLWTHLRLSFELFTRRPRPDVLFVPAHVLPLLRPLPAVVTVHDLGYRYFPGAHPPAQRRYLDWSTRFSARAAAHVLADSSATRADLARFYLIPESKVTVVYPGRDERLRPVDPEPVRARYGLPPGYVLHVGTLQPRKNLARLMDAVAALRPRWPGLTLVLAGRPGWLSAPLLAQARANAAFVRLLDYVPDADLPGLYAGAAVFAFPSLYEGFGFPVLEAMACGVPVVCANAASLPELAGDAALLVDPADTAALAAALDRLLADPALRQALIARGLAHIQRFTWSAAAAQTLQVLETVAQAKASINRGQ
jgi:glycosyltransferase involved in cell wall biosynthesis